MIKKTILVLTIVLFLIFCSKRKTIKQADYDLKGMLENNVEV